MADVNVQIENGVTLDFFNIFRIIEQGLRYMPFYPGGSSTTTAASIVSVDSGNYYLHIVGSGFTYSNNVPVTGTATAITVHDTFTNNLLFTITSPGIDMSVLGQAMLDDFYYGGFAIEELLAGTNITYVSNAPVETLTAGTPVTEDDGWPFALTGNLDITLTNGDDTFDAGSGNDTMDGGNGFDTLKGGAGDDWISGGFNADTITGGAGNDTIFYSTGDVLVYSGRSNEYAITLNLNTLPQGRVTDGRYASPDGADGIFDASADTFLQFSDGFFTLGELTQVGVTILGTAGADIVQNQQTVAGQPKATNFGDTIYGFDGDDRLNGGKGQDSMYGGRGNDTYTVDNAGDKTIEDGGGAVQGLLDLVVSSVDWTLGNFIENLTLSGTADLGAGNTLDNKINGNDSNNLLDGKGGKDVINGRGGQDLIYGGDGNDIINGGDSLDQIYGGTGSDRLDGGTGNDYLFGESGNDFYYVDNIDDLAIETDDFGNDMGGKDTVFASVNGYTLSAFIETLQIQSGFEDGYGNEQNNKIFGNSLDDFIRGFGGVDTLRGNAGNDELRGDDGNDLLDGGAGYDLLLGGNGNDTMTGGLDSADDFYLERFATGKDKITDFQHGIDFLRAEDGDYAELSQGAGFNGNDLDAAYFVSGAGATATANHAQFIYDTTTRTLSYDSNGTVGGGIRDLVTLQTGAVLTVTDLYFDI